MSVLPKPATDIDDKYPRMKRIAMSYLSWDRLLTDNLLPFLCSQAPVCPARLLMLQLLFCIRSCWIFFVQIDSQVCSQGLWGNIHEAPCFSGRKGKGGHAVTTTPWALGTLVSLLCISCPGIFQYRSRMATGFIVISSAPGSGCWFFLVFLVGSCCCSVVFICSQEIWRVRALSFRNAVCYAVWCILLAGLSNTCQTKA